jgi:formate-dependent nitrite reductase membrane component NrfD
VQIAEIVLEFDNESVLSTGGERAGLILLVAMLLSFLLIRVSTRLMRSPKVTWWPGSIETEGGLHVHHLVFGIVLMLFAGFLMAIQPDSPWFELSAAAFGIGAGLTLDEYALWLHLEDVYWAEEGVARSTR